MTETHPDWREHGVRVIKGDRSTPTPRRRPGMHRAAAINPARVGAQKIWAGTVHDPSRTRRPARTTTARWRA